MGALSFDQPSTGTVNNSGNALTITNSGTGSVLSCTGNGTVAAVGAVNNQKHGLWAESKGTGIAVLATSIQECAIKAVNNSTTNATILANNISQSNGTALHAECTAGTGIQAVGKVAGLFRCDVQVTGDIQLVNADCAEEFDVIMPAEPGTVMALNNQGTIEPSRESYDKRVAGVVSGGGGYKPGIVLDKQEQPSERTRAVVALIGKVYCKVDATMAQIEIGDLLTTSSTIGHAMKAMDPVKSFGSVIGKALQPLKDGKGMIPVLVALQ